MTKNESKIKEIMSDKKKRGRVYWTIFLFVLAVLFVVNNINSEEKPGPYPPDYLKLKRSANQTAPGFTLNSTENSEISLETYKEKIVLLKFWDMESNTSLKMIPDLIKLKEKFNESDFEVVSISLDKLKNGNSEELAAYVKSKGINYPVLTCDELTSKKYGNVKETPVVYMIKKDGTIYTRYDGWTPYSILERDVSLLMENAQ